MRKLLSLFAIWTMLLSQSPAQVQMDRLSVKGINKTLYADTLCNGSTDPGVCIDNAEALLPARGGIIDANGFIGEFVIATPIQISKPTWLKLGGNLTYTGAGIANGILQLQAGSSGSIVEGPYTAFATDPGDNGAALTGNIQALVVTPSSSMPVATVATAVKDVAFRNLLIIGNSNVTDGIQHNGGVRLLVDHCLFSRPQGTSSFPTGWGVRGTVAVQDGSEVRASVFAGWAGGVKFDGTTSAPGTGDATLVIEKNQFLDASLGYVSLTTSFDAKVRNNVSGFSFLNASTAGVLFAGTTTTPTVDNFHFDGSNNSGNAGTIDIQFTGTSVGGSITNSTLNGNTNDALAAHDPDHGIDLAAGVTYLTISNNQIINYSAGGTKNLGFFNSYVNNKWGAGHAGGGAEILAGSQTFVLNNSTVPLLAYIQLLQLFRSGGSTSFPDITGDGTNALVIAGKADGSGAVNFGATTTVGMSAALTVGAVITGAGLNASGATLIKAGTTTVASLPSAASNAGAVIRVSDSTAVASEGQTCVGGSSNSALAFSNGTIWKCF